ncbi:MAG: MMPL family transporter, partial [Myxococcales bacterium]|nr:MMPL family transporter [Myxococcales bacterium]
LEPLRRTGFDFNLNGSMIRTVISGRALQASTARIIPALVLVIALVLLIASTSLRQVALALATMGVAVLWTIGLMGWLDWPQDGIHQVLAPLILIVGVCDAVHLLSRASEHEAAPSQSILAACRSVGPPCVVTTTTTATALASFATSDLDCFGRFGAIAATGVAACLILTFSLLPLLASTRIGGSFAPSRPSPRWLSGFAALARFASRSPRITIAVCAHLMAIGLLGIILHLNIDTDWQQAFGENGDISRWARFFDRARGSSDALELELDPPEGLEVHTPEALGVVKRVSAALEQVDGLGQSFGLADLLDRLDRALDSTGSARSGLELEHSAELLELLSMDDPGSLEPWITLDRKATRVSIQADWLAQEETRSLMRRVRSVVDHHVPKEWAVRMSGMRAIDDAWVTEVQTTQLRSFPTAFLFVFALSSLFLRSFRLGLIAMLPSLIAIVVTLGTMGWLGMGLDIGRAMIGAVVIGIGVDDAIHFLDAHRRHLTRGANRHEAVDLALADTGRAIITTSIALALGFLTLMASAWQTISSFGFFVSITIVAALVATLFLLPALLAGFGEQAGAER